VSNGTSAKVTEGKTRTGHQYAVWCAIAEFSEDRLSGQEVADMWQSSRRMVQASVPVLALAYTLVAGGCGRPSADGIPPIPQAEAAMGAARSLAGGWEPLGLSGGGGMFAPAISPVDPDIMMINCDMSGAYVTADGGRHWTMIHHLQLRANTRCRPGFHPTDRNVIYAPHGWSGQIRRSQDRGETWSTIAELPDTPRGEIAFDPDDPSLMLVGTYDGAYLSRDAGRRWEKCDGPSAEALSFFVDRTSPRDARIIYAATRQGIWRSADGGRRWETSTEGLLGDEIRSFSGGSDPDTGKVRLYCAVPSIAPAGRFQGGLFRSLDGGEQWEWAMGEGINRETAAADQWADGSIAQYHHVVTTDAEPDVVYAMNASTGFWPPHSATVYRSDDAGESWRATFFPDPRGDPYNVTPNWLTTSIGKNYPGVPFAVDVCASDPDRVICVTGFCCITQDGGRSWSSAHTLPAPGSDPGPSSPWLCNGLVVTTTWHYYTDPHEPKRHYIAYTDIGFARSLDAGKTWIWWEEEKRAPWPNTCYEIAFDPDTPGKMWGAFSNVHDIPNDNIISGRHRAEGPGGVCVSGDFGESWHPIGEKLPAAPATSIVLDPRSPPHSRTLYVSIFEEGVYKSTDGGETWHRRNRGLGAPDNMRVYRLLLHEDGTLFALITAKRRGRSYLPGAPGLYRSRDGGEAWQCITSSLGLLWPKDVSAHPASSDVLFLGAADAGDARQGGLYRTTDGGVTWQRVAREGRQHFGAYFHPQKQGWAYMTLTEGAPGPSLWLSTDSGDTWRPVESFPFANTQRVAFDPADPETIYVTTFGGSVFRGPASAP
jgi:photosystem II stability/assembly factor-like uncharacterized protein